MSDLITEELEHLEFLQEITALRTRIYSALLTHPTRDDAPSLLKRWNEVNTYGDEPVFQSLVHDRMLREAGIDESGSGTSAAESTD